MIFQSWPTLDLEMDKLTILDLERGIGSPNGQDQLELILLRRIVLFI